MSDPVGNEPIPVIVLNKYTYNIGGITFQSPDTGFSVNGYFVDNGYSAYYTPPGGGQVAITNSSVIVSVPNSFSTVGGNTVTYTVEASDGYKSKQQVRRVYIPDEFCDGTVPAVFTFLTAGGGDITISANIPWSDSTQKATFRAVEDYRQYDGVNLQSYKFGVDFISGSYGEKLDPDNPQPGIYKIAYIAMSRCAAGGGSGIRLFRSAERTVIVE